MRNVVVEAKLARGMTAWAMSPLRSHTAESEHGRVTLTVDVGNVVSGQELELVIAMRFPTGTNGESIECGDLAE